MTAWGFLKSAFGSKNPILILHSSLAIITIPEVCWHWQVHKNWLHTRYLVHLITDHPGFKIFNYIHTDFWHRICLIIKHRRVKLTFTFKILGFVL